MPVLSTFRRYFGFAAESESIAPPPATLEEKLSLAAADRAYAFNLLEDVEEALTDSAALEAQVASASLQLAEREIKRAEERAAEIRRQAEERLAYGQRVAGEYGEQAGLALRNSTDDASVVAAIRRLRSEELHDTGPSGSEGWDA